jgi:hypothetical protein
MPGRYVVEPATADDVGALRALLRSTSMDGPMRLSFQREPDFFAAARVGNLSTSVFVGRHLETGRVIGTATRAFRRVYIDGYERHVGYLSSLRLAEEMRKTSLLARFYRRLRELHSDGCVPFYITTILDGNREARRILTSGRAGLPVYVPYGKHHTYLLPLYRRRRRVAAESVFRGPASKLLPAVFECLNRFHANFQFAPVYRIEDLAADSRMLLGLSESDLYVASRGQEVLGTMAVWDQNRFKQSVVAGYSRGLTIIRPMLAPAARFGLAPRLPHKGQSLPCLYAALVSSRDSDEAVFRELLDTALTERSGTGYAYLVLGLCDRHPFCEIAEKRSAMRIESQIYLVYWRDIDPGPLPSSERIPHLEVATL